MRHFTQTTANLIWIVILLPFASVGQSVATTPLGALPMEYISAFAGSNGGPRISALTGYERQFQDRNTIYQMYASYDQFVPAIRSGIGISSGFSTQHIPARGGWPEINPRFGFVSLAVAPKFSIQGKYTVSPSLNFNYGQSWNLQLATYMDGTFTFRKVNMQSISGTAGILFNSNKFYIGYSIALGGKYFYSDTTSSGTWNIIKNYNSFLQTGYTFQRSSTSKFSFTPQFVLQAYNATYEDRFRVKLFAFILNFRYQKFIWGLNNGGVHLGWQNDKFRFMWTNGLDFLDRNDYDRGYSANLSFRYLIPSDLQKKYSLPGM